MVDEDQGVTELTALATELPKLRSFSADVGAEIGETDPVKAVAKVKELKASVTQYEGAAGEAGRWSASSPR